jgi:hypothetical protein
MHVFKDIMQREKQTAEPLELELGYLEAEEV